MRVFLQTVSGKNAGTRITIQGKRFVIGRAPDCDLRAHSERVGTHHCQILVEPTGVLLQDLNSRNGTFVDGQRVAGAQMLTDGARLQVGPLELLVDIREVESQTMDTAPEPVATGIASEATAPEGNLALATQYEPAVGSETESPFESETAVAPSGATVTDMAVSHTRPPLSESVPFGSQVTLHVASGRSSGIKIPVRHHPFLIGHAPDCDLCVDNDEASQRHCEILVQPNGVLVVDLGSRNGTFVNSLRIEGPHVLENGARLRVGSLELKVEIDNAAPRSFAADDAPSGSATVTVAAIEASPLMPQISAPQIRLPKISSPQIPVPQTPVPQITAMQIPVPQIPDPAFAANGALVLDTDAKVSSTLPGSTAPSADSAASESVASTASVEAPERLPDSGAFDLDQFLTTLPGDPATRPPPIDIMAEIKAMHEDDKREVEVNDKLSTKETREAAVEGLKRLFTPRTPNA